VHSHQAHFTGTGPCISIIADENGQNGQPFPNEQFLPKNKKLHTKGMQKNFNQSELKAKPQEKGKLTTLLTYFQKQKCFVLIIFDFTRKCFAVIRALSAKNMCV
jgi:hypothetical protein